MRKPASQLTLVLVACLLGFLVVVQGRAQTSGAPLQGKSLADLTAIIAQLNDGNDRLRDERSTERDTLDQARANLLQTVNAIADGQNELDRLNGWTGIGAMSGPGIRLTLEGDFPGTVGQDALNELWSAGADGISANGVRIVPGVVIWGALGSTLHVGDTSIGRTLVITVIGDHDALSGALRRAGGYVSQLHASYPAISVTLENVNELLLPATDRSLIPSDAQPHL